MTNCERHTIKGKVVTRIQLQRAFYTFIVRTQTYTTSAWVFRSLSCEPDIVKESVSVSSSPSEKKEKRRREKKKTTEVIESVSCLGVLLAKGRRDTNLVNESWSLLVWVYSHCFESSLREFSSFIGVAYLQCNSLKSAPLNGRNKESGS